MKRNLKLKESYKEISKEIRNQKKLKINIRELNLKLSKLYEEI